MVRYAHGSLEKHKNLNSLFGVSSTNASACQGGVTLSTDKQRQQSRAGREGRVCVSVCVREIQKIAARSEICDFFCFVN